MRYGLVVVLMAAACSSDPSEPNPRRECERIRDHIIELRLQGVTADRDQHRAAFESAFGESFLVRCVEEASPARRRCVLDAKDPQALAACELR